MKYLVASDIHGSAYYCRMLCEAIDREEPDRILFLGDVLYHGPRNDLPKDYAPKEVIAMLTPYKDRITSVRGNCDTEVDQMVLPFPVLAEYAYVQNGESLIFATHGHVYSPDKLPPMGGVSVFLYGHTHIPVCDDCGTHICMNPGSVSIPKEGSAHSFMTLEDGVFKWFDLESGEAYRTYEK